jgi:hypothetical protein
MKVSIILHTKFGDFESEDFDINKTDYENLKEQNKNFFEQSYHLKMPNGFLVVPSEVTKESILEFKIKKRHVAE